MEKDNRHHDFGDRRKHNEKRKPKVSATAIILAGLIISAVKNTPEKSDATPAKSVNPPVTVEVTAPQVVENVNEWSLAPDYVEKIDSLTTLTDQQKAYEKMVVAAVVKVSNARPGINAIAVAEQSAVETGNWSKKDKVLPYNNFLGITTTKSDPNGVLIPSHEKNKAGKLVPKNRYFRTYDTPEDNFNDYANQIKRLPWYGDAVACSGDVDTYLKGLQMKLDVNTCEKIGEESAYANTPYDYVAIAEVRGRQLLLDQVIVHTSKTKIGN